MRTPLRKLYALCCLFTISSSVFAQMISLDPDSLPDHVSTKVISYETLLVNGPNTYFGKNTNRIKPIKLGPSLKIALAALTLKMVAAKKINLREPLFYTLPDILENNPFKVAVTPHHVLTETSGFAVPALLSDAPLKRYATHMRTAGQMAHNDPVGWAILIKFLETKSGKSIHDLFLEHLLLPLGLKASDIDIAQGLTPLQQVYQIAGSPIFIAEIARLMVRNRAVDGKRFLPPALHDMIVKKASWRMHPLSPSRTYGAEIKYKETQRWLETAADITGVGPTIMAFPEAGVSFVHLTGKTKTYEETVLNLAAAKFLPVKADSRLAQANRLVPYERFSGYYVRDDAPSPWLKKRLTGIANEQIYIRERPDGALLVMDNAKDNKTPSLYYKKAPFQYVRPDGNTITLSLYKSGGYLLRGEVLYRYTSILGNKFLVITLFPFVIIALLSSGFYGTHKTDPAWRKMGLYGVTGTLLVCAGLLCDYLWWPSALFIWDMPFLVNIWRTSLNIGLMLVLSMPLFALSFTRENRMPDGLALVFAPLHLGIISVAAVALFLILVAWGVAGEFTAY